MPYKDLGKQKEWYRKRAKTKKYQDYNKKWRLEHKGYFIDWAKNNREKTRTSVKKWRIKNKTYCIKKTREWFRAHPWVVAYSSAKNRCTNPKCERYNRYGGRGIKFNLTRLEVKKLWDRDNASEMKCPTMDRKDNDGNYEYSNCQFLPMSENVAKSNKARSLRKLLTRLNREVIWNTKISARKKYTKIKTVTKKPNGLLSGR